MFKFIVWFSMNRVCVRPCCAPVFFIIFFFLCAKALLAAVENGLHTTLAPAALGAFCGGNGALQGRLVAVALKLAASGATAAAAAAHAWRPPLLFWGEPSAAPLLRLNRVGALAWGSLVAAVVATSGFILAAARRYATLESDQSGGDDSMYSNDGGDDDSDGALSGAACAAVRYSSIYLSSLFRFSSASFFLCVYLAQCSLWFHLGPCFHLLASHLTFFLFGRCSPSCFAKLRWLTRKRPSSSPFTLLRQWQRWQRRLPHL